MNDYNLKCFVFTAMLPIQNGEPVVLLKWTGKMFLGVKEEHDI